MEETLMQLGLSKGESKVYLALLKLDSSPVNKIKQETKLHRTTIYDFIEKLINKGIVSSVIKNNVNFYQAAQPERLFDILKEKEDSLKKVLPELKKLSNFNQEGVSVEVYKGKEGFKSFLNIVLKENKDILGIGIDESMFNEKFPYLMEQHIKKELKQGIKERMIIPQKSNFKFTHKNITYRTLDKEFFDPTPTLVFGNYVANIIWEPLTIILIKNKNLSLSFKSHLEMIWKIAKKH